MLVDYTPNAKLFLHYAQKRQPKLLHRCDSLTFGRRQQQHSEIVSNESSMPVVGMSTSELSAAKVATPM